MDFENYAQKDILLENMQIARWRQKSWKRCWRQATMHRRAHTQPQRILVMQSREALRKAEECIACKFHAPVT